MSAIKGRADDMLIIRGVNLFHTQVEEVIHEFDFLSPNYQLIVERIGTMDTVNVRVECAHGADPGNSDLNDQITRKLKDTIGISMEVALESPGAIPRSEGGKLNRIVDKRV